MKYKKQCRECGHRFDTDVTSRVYCSIDCRYDAGGAKQGKFSEIIIKECEFCNDSFKTDLHHKKYCSRKCGEDYQEAKRSRGKFLVYYRDNFTCFYCGRVSFKDNKELRVDHVYPRSKGGNNYMYNLVTTCFECNASKSDMIMEESILEEIKKEVMSRHREKNIIPTIEIDLWKIKP